MRGLTTPSMMSARKLPERVRIVASNVMPSTVGMSTLVRGVHGLNAEAA